MTNTFYQFHGHHSYIAEKYLTEDGRLCVEGLKWLTAQADTEWHVIDGKRDWPAAPLRQIVWFESKKLAALFRIFFS